MTQRKIRLHASMIATLQHCWWMVVFTFTFTVAACFTIVYFALLRRITPVQMLGQRLQYVIALLELIACIWLGVRCFKFLEPRLMRFFRVRQGVFGQHGGG